MLIQGNFLKPLVKAGQDFRQITGRYYQWDPEKPMFQIHQNTFIKSCVVGTILGIFQFLNLLLNQHKIKTENGNISIVATLNTYLTTEFIWFIHYSFSMAYTGVEFQNFINAAYKFEQAQSQQMFLALKEKSNKRIMTFTKLNIFMLSHPAIKVLPFIFALLFPVITPELPLNTFSLYPGKFLSDMASWIPSNSTLFLPIHYTTLVVTFIWNWLCYLLLLKGNVLSLIQILLGNGCLTVYLSIVKRKVKNNRGRGAKIFNGTNIDATTIYRQIEILVHSFNRAHSGQLVMILLALLTITVICSLSVIKALTSGTFTDPRSFYANCFFAYSVMNSIILLLMVYGLCGNLHQDASRCVAEMRRTALTCEPRQRKLLQRTVMALPVLKIEFGDTNFVEKMTPFVYLEFALGRIIDGLLLSKPK
ncbi:unnamed protein product [Orchesella dallaii]|uniref:Odorant receptor n=1 Tax=Orchesella dallaii TaxID=48710 RepID=A0ABP1S8S1_9HEXA